MSQFAVVKTGGKQYIVKQDDEIIVDFIDQKEKESIDLPVLATFDKDSGAVELGMPEKTEKLKAVIVAQVRGDKIRVAKFKPKVRYRKVRGFKARLTKLKILKIGN